MVMIVMMIMLVMTMRIRAALIMLMMIMFMVMMMMVTRSPAPLPHYPEPRGQKQRWIAFRNVFSSLSFSLKQARRRKWQPILNLPNYLHKFDKWTRSKVWGIYTEAESFHCFKFVCWARGKSKNMFFVEKVKFSLSLWQYLYSATYMMGTSINETFSMSAKVPSCSREITTIS